MINLDFETQFLTFFFTNSKREGESYVDEF